ncbi:MAG: hypothetical protein AAF791_09600, partial [Bacteroidota bacterium]
MKTPTLLWILVVLGGLLALVVLASPTPMDTRIRLEREGSAPFDAEVFYESLAAWVGTEVTPVD